MTEEKRERWQELAAQASKEENPVRLMDLTREISEILEEKERINKAQRKSPVT